MTPVILLILAVVWIVVLAPGLWKKWSERQASGSIESFHEGLRLLERTGPKLVTPAYRLATAHSHTGLAPSQSGFPAVTSTPGRPTLVLMGPADPFESWEGAGPTRASYSPTVTEARPGERSTPVAGEPQRAGRKDRPRAPGRHIRRRNRRKRQVPTLLGMSIVATGLAGLSRSLRPLWIVTAIMTAALAGYIALAVYAARLSAESRRRAARAARRSAHHERLVAEEASWRLHHFDRYGGDGGGEAFREVQGGQDDASDFYEEPRWAVGGR